MIRLFILVIISLCFTTVQIYATCDLPTGGACNIEELKEEQKKFSETLIQDNYLQKLHENSDKKLEQLTKPSLEKEKLMKTVPEN